MEFDFYDAPCNVCVGSTRITTRRYSANSSSLYDTIWLDKSRRISRVAVFACNNCEHFSAVRVKRLSQLRFDSSSIRAFEKE